MVKISRGNSKIGNIPNVSLTPVRACGPGVKCATACYAMKAYRQHSKTRNAWDNNLALAQSDPKRYFAQIDTYLTRRKPRLFRWHVAGDILNRLYGLQMAKLAENHPETQFLAFTKRAGYIPKLIPVNLRILYSCWPGVKLPRGLRVNRAWMQDGTETRIPKDAVPCLSNCTNCLKCWNDDGKDVVFNKH